MLGLDRCTFNDIAVGGRWQQHADNQSLAISYLGAVNGPVGCALAGHGSDPRQFILDRDYEPPESLAKRVFPWIEQREREVAEVC